MVQLQLSDEQAKIVARACEFYSRIIMGQFKEIIFELVNSETIKSVTSHKDEIENLLYQARDLLYPELSGYGSSYGVGAFERADKAYDVYQALRVLFGDTRQPFSYYKLPEAHRYEDAD